MKCHFLPTAGRRNDTSKECMVRLLLQRSHPGQVNLIVNTTGYYHTRSGIPLKGNVSEAMKCFRATFHEIAGPPMHRGRNDIMIGWHILLKGSR